MANGYGVNYHAPIAQAINNLNQQLNLNAQRADDREARGMRNLLTASQLQTQQEDRGLARRAAERADSQLEESIKANDHNRKMAINRDNRAAVADKRAGELFDAQRLEAQAKTIKLKAAMTPAEVNLYDQIGDDSDRTKKLLSDPRNKAMIESLHGGDVIFNPDDGFLYNKSGKKVKISPMKYDTIFGPKMFNLPFVMTDPAAVVRGDVAEYTKQLNVNKAALKALTNNKNKSISIREKEKGILKGKIATLEGQMNATINTPIDTMIERYVERGDKLTQFAMANQYNPELLNQVEIAQKQNEAMLNRLYRKQTQKLKDGGTKGFGTDDKWRQVDVSLTDFYYDKDASGQYIKNKVQQDRYDAAMKLAAKYIKDGAWHMDAVNLARTDISKNERKYFNIYDRAIIETGDHKKAVEFLRTKKIKGKTVDERFEESLGYLPSLKTYRKEKQKRENR